MAEETKILEGDLSKSAEIAGKDVESALNGLSNGDLGAIYPLLEGYLIPVALAVLFVIIGYFIARFCSRICSSPITRRVDETLGKFVGKLVFYGIMIFVLLGVLGRFGISVASFAAVVAAAGFAIGLAFQGTLSNFAAGVLLLVFRPFRVGDVVNAAGITAKVDEIDLFTTTLNTPDNRRIIVPNSAISSGTIENITFHKERRVDVEVGVDYSASIDLVRKTLSNAAQSLSEYLIEGEGRGVAVVLTGLGDSSVNWTIRFWTTADNYWNVKELLLVATKEHLDSAGVGIPYPQLDIHFDALVQNMQKAANQ